MTARTSSKRSQSARSRREEAHQAEHEHRILAEAQREITALLSSSLDLDVVLERILTNVGRVVPFDAGTILMIEGDHVKVTHAQGYDQEILGVKLPLKETTNLLRILETGRPSLIEDTHTSDIWIPSPQTSWIRSSLGVAIHADERVIGFLSLERDTPHAFTAEHIERLQSFAHQAGVAVRNAHLYAAAERARRTTETLRSAQLALTQSLDLDAICEAFLDYLARLVPYDSATMFLLEPDAQLHARAVRGYERWLDPDVARAVAFDPQVSPVMRTLVTSLASLSIPDTREHPGWVRVPSAEHIRSWLGVPMVAGGKVIGVYSVDSTQPNVFTQEHIQLAESLAVQAAFALQNARLFEAAQRRAAELEALRRSSLKLTSSLDLASVLDSVAESVLSLVGADNCHIYLYDQDKEAIAFSNALWKDGRRETVWEAPRAGGLTATVAREGRPVVINDAPHHPLFAAPEAQQWGIQAIAGLPLKRAERVLGVLNIVFYEPHTFVEEELQVLSLLADQATSAVENAHLFAQVESQKRYSESLVQNSQVAIVSTDRDGNVLSWNPAAERLFGYAQSEALGQTLDGIISTPELHAEAVAFTRQAASGAHVHAVTRRRRRDGTLVDVEVLAVPVDAEDPSAGLIAIYHDITELLQARREAEAATQAKSAFLATMSHEIRTPMNAVIGMTSLLLDTPLTSEQREFAETIRSSGDALLAVINDILDFSKIEAGRIELERQPFDLRECVDGAVALLAPRATEKGLELVCHVDAEVPPAVVGDEARLRQILLNLLSNAVKFTEHGEVVLTVEREAKPAGVSAPLPTTFPLHFSVRDTGIGIPPDRADRLFKSFSQVDGSTTRKYGGTGLGLAISDRLCALMDGRLWVESPSPVLPSAGEAASGGPGSIFHFSVVMEKAEVLPRAFLRGEQADLRGRRVLIVDDNEASRRILTLQTEGWGMAVLGTGSPPEALEWLRRGEPFDVALIDRQMPEMDGLMLAAEIRKLRDAAALPLVMVSSLGGREARAEADTFAAFLLKPIRASQLYAALVGILAAQGLQAPREKGTASQGFDAEMGTRWPLCILLAEDHPTNQKLALLILGRLGYRADVAANGLEVVQALARQPYDVVLMDVQMPEMDGLEATRQIRRRWPREEAPRIIAMTANVAKEDREACFAAGMDDYLGKPIRVEALVAALGRCRSLPEPPPPAGGHPAQVEAPEAAAKTTSPESGLDRSALETLLELVGGEQALLGELIDSFLQETPPLLATLRRSLEASDAAGLRKVAHTLKSSSRDFGATRLSELARELEAMGKAGALAAAAALVAQVEAEYPLVQVALEGVRRGESPGRSA